MVPLFVQNSRGLNRTYVEMDCYTSLLGFVKVQQIRQADELCKSRRHRQVLCISRQNTGALQGSLTHTSRFISIHRSPLFGDGVATCPRSRDRSWLMGALSYPARSILQIASSQLLHIAEYLVDYQTVASDGLLSHGGDIRLLQRKIFAEPVSVLNNDDFDSPSSSWAKHCIVTVQQGQIVRKLNHLFFLSSSEVHMFSPVVRGSPVELETSRI